jgi:F0F1-type ATP synthase assembly protein I
MAVGPAGDKYEREADHVAKQVLGQIKGSGEQPVQRQGTEGEDASLVQLKPLQRQIGMEGGDVSGDVESSIDGSRGSGRSIDENVRSSMEDAFGADFSDVKVHSGAESTALNDSMSARAFTTGKDIFFRQGEYNPGSDAGKEILAHELTHVVQQTSPSSVNRAPQVVQKVDDDEKEKGKTLPPLTAPATNGPAAAPATNGPAAAPATNGPAAAPATPSVDEAVASSNANLNLLGAANAAGKSSTAIAALEGAKKTTDAMSGFAGVGAATDLLSGGADIYQGIKQGGAVGNTKALAGAGKVGRGGTTAALLAGSVGASALPPALIVAGAAGAIAAGAAAYTSEQRKKAQMKVAEGSTDPEVIAAANSAATADQAQKEAGLQGVLVNTAAVVGASVLIGTALTNPVGLGILAAAGLIAGGMIVVKKLSQVAAGHKLVKAKEDENKLAIIEWEKDGKPGKKPVIDPAFDRERLGSWPWDRGYGTIFREDQEKQKTKIADTLYAATNSATSGTDDKETKAFRQIVINMKLEIDLDDPEKPKHKQILDKLKPARLTEGLT